MKKHLFTRLAAFILVFTCLLSCATLVNAAPDPIYDIALDSQGAYLVNLETGTVLYEKNAGMRMFPASLTKILTALVVLDNCSDPENTTITVTDTSLFQPILDEGGVNMDIRTGESFSVQNLLVGMMLNSYCDAAELLAWHFGGESTEKFVDMMNQKAAEIGMTQSHFVNAHGLHDPDHWSCPRDIALLMEKAVQDPRFVAILERRGGSIPATELHAARQFVHTVNIFYKENPYYLDAFVGGKSGFTDQARRCLATYSTKDGVSYISVMMGANMDGARKYSGNMAFVETSTLLAYVYENYSLQTLLEKGQQLSEIPILDSDVKLPVVAGEDVILLARNESTAEYSLDLPEAISAAEVEDGTVVGSVSLTINGETAEGAGCPLLLQWDGKPITTKSFLEKEGKKVGEAVRRIFTEDKNFVILVILLVVIVILSIPAVKLTQRAIRKKAKRPKH